MKIELSPYNTNRHIKFYYKTIARLSEIQIAVKYGLSSSSSDKTREQRFLIIPED